VASILANRPKLSGWMVYVATALPLAIILGTGLFFLVRPAEETATGAPTAAALAPPGPLNETATDNKFGETTWTVVAGQQYTLNFTNAGTALHNWHLKGVPGADGKDVQTKLTPGGGSETVNFTVPQPGDYQFICDVHPAEMVGTLTAVAGGAAGAAAGGGGAAGGAAAGPTKIDQVATDNKFALTELVANANEETTLTLENKGSAVHNLHIMGVMGADGKPITTPLSPGGKTDTITFTIATPGTYDFLCDVHPAEMKGKITVK
jgi:plastocyanin